MNRGKLVLISFIVFCALYVGVLLTNSQLGPTDDFIFLRTLQAGKPLFYYSADFPYYSSYESGRFTPLVAAEYNIYNLFTKSPSPFWYYFSHAIELFIFVILSVKIFSLVLPQKYLVYLTTALITLTPGFTFTWFRLQLNERNLLVLLALFFWFYFAYWQSTPNQSEARFRARPKLTYLIASLLAANLAIYYKETAFIAIGAFALSHFILLFLQNRQQDQASAIRHWRLAICDLLLILSSLLYLTLYAALVLPYRGIFTYGKNAIPIYIGALKSLLNYAFVSEPVIIFIVLPLTFWRLYQIWFKKLPTHHFYDAALLAASIYVLAFFGLNLSGVYYFLPIYIFALPAVFFFLRQSYYQQPAWKILIGVVAFFSVVNTLPLGLHYLTYYKYLPINFNRALDFIVTETENQKSAQRVNIFFAGMNKGSSNWNYFIISEFLLHKGLTPGQFDLKAEIEDEKVLKAQPLPLAIPKITLPYSVFQGDGPSRIQSGDYLVVSPHSTDFVKNNSNKEYLKSLGAEYKLVFRTHSRFEFPQATLKELSRFILAAGGPPEEKFLGLISRKKPNWESPDYYVFVKK